MNMNKNKLCRTLLLSSLLLGGTFTLSHAQDEPLVAGIEAAFPPWAYAQGGEYKGIAVDAMRAIAENQGLEVEFRDMPWPSLIPALANERIDLLVTGLNVTRERNEVLDFTIPWWENDDEVLVNADSELNVVTALCCGATIGAQGGSTQHSWIQANLVENEDIDVTLRSYEDYVTAIEDMGVGRIDSVVVSTDTAEDFISKGRDVRIAGTITQGQPQALAVSRGDPNGILGTLNRGIMELYESGKWQEIVHSYAPYATIRQIPATMPDYVRTYQEPIAGLGEE
ncbi:arginine/ornithine-binding protein AotJ [Litchfieldella qijiaojingensis]|uniref:Arginine/ornithine-binding protein AotJ n=2 Tax=Litchfieldella qijiaojingensis TaxID=980347 RepID=A0ABQ2ZE25_9GAMM|nr:arginine/ornithine-binding protein AotJ [Halomonas qijiaojingensis]